MAGNSHVLPDSRLHDQTQGSQVVDWPLPGGGTVRLEAVRIYCANCGKLYGWVPKDNTAFACWLCAKCFEKYGEAAGLCAVPDEEFRQAVQAEMRDRFGRDLTDAEIAALKSDNRLGRALELLERESPYPVPSGA
jgi:hypothetical protein